MRGTKRTEMSAAEKPGDTELLAGSPVAVQCSRSECPLRSYEQTADQTVGRAER